MRFNLSAPEALVELAREAAARESAERGKPMPVSEWIRSAIIQKLEEVANE